MRENKQKVLLHACCAICSAYPIENLRELGYEPVVYFYNPNIFPDLEYQKRIEAQRKLCASLECDLIEETYEPEYYFEHVKGLENEPEKGKRCDKCFEIRLEKTARKAKELSFEFITTSIVISPHKNFQLISQLGDEIAKANGINYLAVDFKKKDGFLKSNKIAKELELYRQNYCGCKFSIR